MPALYTHYKFGQDVLNKLNKNLQNNIKENIDYYNMYNQGFDNLYYYHKWTYYRNFGIKAHQKNIDKFFTNLFNYIKDNELENDSKITNIIYGFINHYTMDTIIHPFINYQEKHLGITHTKIEFMLDYYLFSKENVKWQNKIYNTLIPRLKFNNNLMDTLDYVFLKTHKKQNMGKIFNRSHNNGYYIYRYFITDFYGIKTFLYKIVDFIIKSKKIKFSNTTFNKHVDLKILNNDNLLWHNPKNKREIYNYSFEELYKYTHKLCINLCNEAYNVLNNKKRVEDFIILLNDVNIKNIH